MDNISGFSLARHSIRDIADVRSPVGGHAFEVTQLRSGRFFGRVSSAMLGESSFIFGRLDCQSPVRARGDFQPAVLSVVFKLGAGQPARVWGTETAYGGDAGVMFSTVGGEFDTANPGGRFGHASIFLPEAAGLHAAGVLYPGLLPHLGSPALWTPTAGPRKTLRQAVFEARTILKRLKDNPSPQFDSKAFAATLAAAFFAAMEPAEGTQRRPLPPADARLVREVEDLLRQDAGAIVSVADLCLRLGVSRRRLERAFRYFLDTSPLKYIMVFRLCRAHRELAQGMGPVTDVATRHGFYELGRFSKRYRQLFGELPSETLAMKKRRPSSLSLSLEAISGLIKRIV